MREILNNDESRPLSSDETVGALIGKIKDGWLINPTILIDWRTEKIEKMNAFKPPKPWLV